MAENNHDFAHFQYVHGTESIPDGEETIDGTYKSVKNPGLERETFGLGLGVVRVPGMLTFVSSVTPIDAEQRARALVLHRARSKRASAAPTTSPTSSPPA